MIVGRKKDLIIRGGVNIAPPEIDAVLHGIAGVAEAAAAGVPDSIYGEEVVGFVVPSPGATLSRDEILASCRRALPAFKTPKDIVLVAALPKNARGKLDRKALAALWADPARRR